MINAELSRLASSRSAVCDQSGPFAPLTGMNAVNDSREVLTSVKHLETTSRAIFASTTTHESRKLNYFNS
jgi:hypothetical protein